MTTKHAEFSPSSMDAKIKCPGRHLATLGLESESSAYAERGTEVHDFCEQTLQKYMDHDDYDIPEFVEDWQEDCAHDMMQHVSELAETMREDGKVDVYLEETVSLATYKSKRIDLAEVWGTGDVILACPDSKTIAVVDYKTGVGVPVSPVENVQMMIYGLGAVATLDWTPEKVLLCVSQPRVEPELQIWETDFVTLNHWLWHTLEPKLVEMSQPGAEFVPGESQCRFCPIKGRCKAQRDEMLALFDTTEPNQEGAEPAFSDDEINALMLRLPEFKQWIKQIEAVAMETLERGDELPDFKLVRGKSNRRWVDADKVDTYLKGQGLKDKERYTRKILSPAQAEKALKDKLNQPRVRTNFDKLWEKPEGNLSWALKSDPRPGVVVDKVAELNNVNLQDLL